MDGTLDEKLALDPDTVPRCSHCGWPLVPWVRDDTFLKGELWHREWDSYRGFLKEWADGHPKLLLLGLGVGSMTPGVITLPLWSMAHDIPGRALATVNLSPA